MGMQIMVAWNRTFLSLAVLVTALGPFGAFAAGPPSELTLAELYQGATASRKILRNLKVEYAMSLRSLAADQVMLDENNLATTGICKTTFAFEGERRFVTQAWDKTSGPVAQTTRVFDGKNGFFYRTGSLMVTPGKDAGIDKGEYYCTEMLHLPISDELRANFENTWHFPHCLRSGVRDDIVVLPEQQQIDGAWCHVVACADVQKLWIDPKIGFALRRMESYRSSGRRDEVKEATPGMLAEYSFSKFLEPVEGLWLPGLCHRLSYPLLPPIEKPHLEMRIEVTSLVVNSVSDSDFDIALPPGTMVLGNTIGFITKGDKTMLMDTIANGLAANMPQRRSWWFVPASILGLLVVLAVYARFRSSRNS